jgi:hypothetical protein
MDVDVECVFSRRLKYLNYYVLAMKHGKEKVGSAGPANVETFLFLEPIVCRTVFISVFGWGTP